ncbi:MAG: acyl-CoA dehydratase activase [Acidobacteriia bacterium]|nr:acyl-CoA dehydratase activase [Terriglobia bacterium]
MSEVKAMRYAAGVDVGSTQTKAVIMQADGGEKKMIASALVDTGANVQKAGENGFLAACKEAGIAPEQVGYVVGTGYGRYKIQFGNTQMTEISCHARGAHFLFPNTRTVIDMGGQDSKAISIGAEGNVLDFVMNDKCAAGTGRFLANAADVLAMPLDDMGPFSLKGKNPVKITTVCTVFVESDILSYLAQGKKAEDVLSGVNLAIARRTISLARRVPVEPAITMTGGVSRNVGMVKALEDVLGMKLQISPLAHFAGAMGAALYALEKMDQDSEAGVRDGAHGTNRGN